jgi:catechol 2,3-dioxygenase
VAVRGINHVVLKVRSLEEAERFYVGALGLRRVGERGRMRFYTAGAHAHDLALVEVGGRAGSPRPSDTGLFHLCFDVEDEAALADVYRRCVEAGAEVLGAADHTVMRSFYARDPDGHVVEVGFDVPEAEWAGDPDPYGRDKAYTIPVVNSER